MKKILLATTIIAGLTFPAFAQDTVVVGFGANPCSNFTKDTDPAQTKNAEEYLMFYLTWVQGAISSADTILGDSHQDTVQIDAWDLDKMGKFIANYCKSNPTKRVDQAAAALFNALPVNPTKKGS